DTHGPGGEVGADAPHGRAGNGAGQTAAAGAEAAGLGGRGGGEELDVSALRRDSGARRTAVDARGAHARDELAVEPGVAGRDGRVAAVAVAPDRGDPGVGHDVDPATRSQV